jgi:DNA-binding transcriptional ArsR family regulator
MTTVDWNYRLRCGEGLKPGWAGIMQLTNGFVAAGLPDTSISTYLLDADNIGATYINLDSKGQVRPRATRERFVRDAIRKARGHQRGNHGVRDRHEAVEALVGLRELVDQDPTRWRGRSGAITRTVLYAAFEIAIARGSFEFNASVRQLADASNVGVKGAHSAIRRLTDWFDVISLGTGTRATTFRFKSVHEVPTATLTVLVETEPEGCREFLAHDIWRHDGLGKSTARVYQSARSMTWAISTDIAAELGLTRRTVTKHLTKLKAVGIAASASAGFEGTLWVVYPTQFPGHPLNDLDAAAAALGILGKGQEQRARNQERAQHRAEFLRNQRQRKQADSNKRARGTDGNARSLDAS